MSSTALTSGAAPSPPAVKETVALALVVAAAAATTAGVPLASWRASPFDPCHLAALAAIATVAALVVTHHFGDRAVHLEKQLCAVFLAGMPLVYVGSFFLGAAERPPAFWLYVELAAVPVYGAAAWLGLRRWPWLLAAGIALHGLGWDAWHYGRTSFVPDWYVVGCLVLDVTLAAYVAVRLGRWRRS
jgi:hypothetical protein